MDNSCDTSQEKGFRERLKSARFWKIVAGITLGGTIGFLYYYFVGCSTGSCAITSNPFSSILFGSAMGFYVVNSPCSSC